MSFSSLLEHPALALYSIPAVWVLAYVPAFLKNATITRAAGWDNVAPRENIARVRDAEKTALIKRMDGAHQNGLEILPLWIGAVLAGTATHLDTRTMNVSAVSFITLRALYVYVYVTHKTSLQSLARTFLWLGSTGIALRLLLKAGSSVTGEYSLA
ncbi:hypothetical protein F5I97DRAFT_1105039 [Phlebopus sp. FC_14]|nr:hypothetical protein F5I97DRAFT_1105039 [Phlebopus sp. FC_14]